LTLNKEQQNLVNDLRAPIKSFRIFALEEAIKTGASSEVLQVLNELKAEEDDGECQILINYAISAVEERLKTEPGSKKAVPKKLKEQQEFFEAWNRADDKEKMQILSDLPARLPQAIRSVGPSLLVTEKSTVIAARIIRIFCRGWPEDQFKLISDQLASTSLSLRLASLRTIVHMKPELLIDDLPTLLNSDDPQIKALAIRGLVKIDKEEALNHLQALLLSSNLSDRLAGIQNCPFLPFPMVKPVLLKYFAAENHPDLLVRAGWILEMNPDVQVPFKLYEIAERSPAKKAELVRKILNEAVKLLEKSGILGSDFKKYTRQLQAWVNKRNALRFTQKIAQKLEAEEIPQELDQLIRNRLNQPQIKMAFAEALNWPVSETIKGRISAYLKSSEEKGVAVNKSAQAEAEPAPEKHPITTSGSDIAEKAPSEDVKPVPKIKKEAESQKESVVTAQINFTNMADGDLIRLFASFNIKDAMANLAGMQKLVADRNLAGEVRLAALNCLTRLRIAGAENEAESLVSGNELALTSSALEYLGEIDPERVFPYLGKCLKVPDVHIKSVALGILKNFDFNQAVSSLNAMLRSTDLEQQRMALKCMEQFDFALIRDQLTEFLEKCTNESLVEAGLCYFAANPASENVYCLFKIEQAQGGKMAEYARKMRESCSQALKDAVVEVSSPAGAVENEPENEDLLKQRWQDEQNRKKQARPAYAYQEKSSQDTVGLKENIAAIFASLKEFASARSSLIALIILVILAAGFYTLFMPGSSAESGAKAGSAVITGQYLREGTVTRTSGTAVEFSSRNGEKFIIHPVREGYRMPTVNTRLRVSLVPYRRDPDGVFLARIRAMRQIESFSESLDSK
jgi:HEAT repeat protein